MTLHIHQLAFERHNNLLFNEINCTLNASEIWQVRGANGSGKSTLLRILAGYIRPDTGTISWQGKNIYKQIDDYTQQICYLGHQNGIKQHLTVYENLKLFCALIEKKFTHAQLTRIINSLSLSTVENTQALHLSAGQKRRLALARFKLSAARLWILDEPTTALDVAGQNLLTDLLNQHTKHGGMAIIATHTDINMKGICKTHHLSGANHV